METPYPPLRSKVALVTGASRRIGREIGLRLARDGAAVGINARSSKVEAQAVAETITDSGGRATVAMGDITDPSQCAAIVETVVAQFGRLDIVVHNAVQRNHKTLEDLDLADWRAALAVVLDGGFLISKFAAPHLKKQGGTIIMIGGASALVGSPGPATPTAKAGLIGLVRSLAVSLGPHDVTANLVCPGRIEDPQDEAERQNRVGSTRPVNLIPLRRSGTLADVAGTVAALAGDDMRYVTGQIINVTGGFYMG